MSVADRAQVFELPSVRRVSCAVCSVGGATRGIERFVARFKIYIPVFSVADKV